MSRKLYRNSSYEPVTSYQDHSKEVEEELEEMRKLEHLEKLMLRVRSKNFEKRKLVHREKTMVCFESTENEETQSEKVVLTKDIKASSENEITFDKELITKVVDSEEESREEDSVEELRVEDSEEELRVEESEEEISKIEESEEEISELELSINGKIISEEILEIEELDIKSEKNEIVNNFEQIIALLENSRRKSSFRFDISTLNEIKDIIRNSIANVENIEEKTHLTNEIIKNSKELNMELIEKNKTLKQRVAELVVINNQLQQQKYLQHSNNKEKENENAIIIESKNKADNPNEIRKNIRKEIIDNNMKEKVKEITVTKKNRIVIKTMHKENQTEIIKALQESEVNKGRYEIRESKVRKYKFMVMNVEEEVSKDVLADALISYSAQQNCDTEIEIIGETGVRNGKKHWIIQTDDVSIYKTFLRNKKLMINMFSYTIQPYINIIKCYKCQKLGHMANTCRNNQTCGHCGGHHEKDLSICKGEHYCVRCNTNSHSSSKGFCMAIANFRKTKIKEILLNI